MADIDWALLLQEVGYYSLPDSLTDTAYVAVGMLAALPAGTVLVRMIDDYGDLRARIRGACGR